MQRVGDIMILLGCLLLLPLPSQTILTRNPSRFFRSSEKFTPNALYPDLKPEDHGDSGPWQTSYSYCSDICKQSLVALDEVCALHLMRHDGLIKYF